MYSAEIIDFAPNRAEAKYLEQFYVTLYAAEYGRAPFGNKRPVPDLSMIP